ncbi:hypothetical protein PBY51_004388 [Eleginops maclovinus]|uniref:Uncharacterized protein n=1 Tax=Eleginops maclovinus TaxID=56733 RepID=A0AAN7Y2N1_ELEMC|nr:hypothetical protein PBY51_004388 [Eleginops maclovinus]
MAPSLHGRTTRWISSTDRKKGRSSYGNVKNVLEYPAKRRGSWRSVGARPGGKTATGCGVGAAEVRLPSTEPGRERGKQMKSTRHGKLSILKSEPLRDFTVLSGTTRNTIKLT